MTCTNAQDNIMLYLEKRIKPFKAIALHRHINKCEDCRELFLAMDAAANTEPCAAPDGFTEMVMAKISSLPTHRQVLAPCKPAANWLRLVGCLYVLLLALGTQISYPLPNLGEWSTVLFNIFTQITQTGQTIILYTADLIGVHILIFAVALVMTAIGIDVGKKTQA